MLDCQKAVSLGIGNFLMKTTLVLTMTADGKIADVQKSPPTFSSKRDYAHLEEQMALADVILVGSGTLNDGGETVLVSKPELIQSRTDRGQAPQPIQIICSRTGKLDRELPFFSQPISRWLITTNIGATNWLDITKFDRVLVCETTDGDIDWQAVTIQLAELNIKNICCLGGSELAASLFAAKFIDELWLTICPFIYGGSAAPSPVSGLGFTPDLAPRLELLTIDRVEQEIFLHYRVKK
jgi:5-amino-6-(5-phosphoribosylamino)uracil reductase